METKPTYFKKRRKAFSAAFKGIGYFFAKEAHARIHLIATVLVIIAGFLFHISNLEWLAIIICIALVLAAEAINSAIEMITDSIYKEIHPVAGRIKDVAAGAVLICSIAAFIVACIIFIPYFERFFE